MLYAGLGRIAGISGLLNQAIEQRGDRGWRIAFLLSLMLGSALWFAFGVGVPAPRDDFPLGWLIASGLLVGFGTRLGNGCTSGHGVCGLARLSRRSLAAVLVFIASGMATVYALRHLAGGIA
ncbi:MAG: YeeE/YedE family protein [Lysobacteraceae bacterium]|nr:MAG: YeeE/YedE family protein [Xanthomonadaceae bacterium]